MSNQKQGDLQRDKKQSGQGDQNRNEAQDDQQGQNRQQQQDRGQAGTPGKQQDQGRAHNTQADQAKPGSRRQSARRSTRAGRKSGDPGRKLVVGGAPQ